MNEVVMIRGDADCLWDGLGFEPTLSATEVYWLSVLPLSDAGALGIGRESGSERLARRSVVAARAPIPDLT